MQPGSCCYSISIFSHQEDFSPTQTFQRSCHLPSNSLALATSLMPLTKGPKEVRLPRPPEISLTLGLINTATGHQPEQPRSPMRGARWCLQGEAADEDTISLATKGTSPSSCATPSSPPAGPSTLRGRLAALAEDVVARQGTASASRWARPPWRPRARPGLCCQARGRCDRCMAAKALLHTSRLGGAMPGPSLLTGTLRGGESQTPAGSRAGTDGPRPLPTGTGSREDRHPLGPRGLVQCNRGRPTPGPYHCRDGGNLSPHGRRHWGESPPGRPHCIEGRSPPPRSDGPAAGGETNPGRHRGTGGTAPHPSPQPSPQRLLPASATGAAPADPAAERHTRACAPSHLLRPSCVLASEATPSRPPSPVRSPRREAAENRTARLICISPAPQRIRVAAEKGSSGLF